MTEECKVTETMQDIPYSKAHFFNISMTGGQWGLNKQITSFKNIPENSNKLVIYSLAEFVR